jgi:hypothetical protein
MVIGLLTTLSTQRCTPVLETETLETETPLKLDASKANMGNPGSAGVG